MLVALHPVDDAVHHGHRIHRIIAGGGFRRQHDRVGAVIDGGGHVRRLGAGGRGRMDHGIQHLGGDHHRLAGGAAGLDDALLQDRHGLGRAFHAQIAARHHDGVAHLDDLVQMLDGLRLFQLGQQAHARPHLLGDQAARLGHVLGTLDEGQRDPVRAHGHGEVQIRLVLLGQRRDGQKGVGDVDALVVGQVAAHQHAHVGKVGAVLFHPHAQAAVVQQQLGALGQRGENLGVGQRRALGGAHLGRQIEAEMRAAFQMDLAAFELAHAQLGTLQVGQHGDGAAHPALQLADGVVAGLMIGIGAVAEVQPEHVGSGDEQALDRLRGGRGRPQRGDDLRVSCSTHRGFLPSDDGPFGSGAAP